MTTRSVDIRSDKVLFHLMAARIEIPSGVYVFGMENFYEQITMDGGLIFITFDHYILKIVFSSRSNSVILMPGMLPSPFDMPDKSYICSDEFIIDT